MKKHYKVAVTEMFRKVIVVGAESEAEAHQRSSDAWQNGEILLSDRNFDGAEFHVLGETDEPEDYEEIAEKE